MRIQQNWLLYFKERVLCLQMPAITIIIQDYMVYLTIMFSKKRDQMKILEMKLGEEQKEVKKMLMLILCIEVISPLLREIIQIFLINTTIKKYLLLNLLLLLILLLKIHTFHLLHNLIMYHLLVQRFQSINLVIFYIHIYKIFKLII